MLSSFSLQGEGATQKIYFYIKKVVEVGGGHVGKYPASQSFFFLFFCLGIASYIFFLCNTKGYFFIKKNKIILIRGLIHILGRQERTVLKL